MDVAHQHGVLALGAGRQHRDRGADQLFETADVFDRGGGQIGPGPRAAGAFAPTLGGLVDRLELGLRGGAGRQVIVALPAMPIGGADLDLVEAVEHVELGQRDAVDAADLDRLAHQRGVEPAAAPRPAGDGAELVAALAEPAADLVVELGRERAAADPRGVGLGDAEHIADGADRQAGAGGGLAGGGVRRGDEGIGAVVDVEHHPLGALEQDAVAAPPRLGQALPDAADIGQQAGRDGEQLGLERRAVDRRRAEAAEQRIVMQQQVGEPRR